MTHFQMRRIFIPDFTLMYKKERQNMKREIEIEQQIWDNTKNDMLENHEAF